MSKFNATTGEVVYKHTLKAKLGGGNFGEVWLAHDEAIGQDFAIKLLDPSRTSIIDELQEAKVGHQMDHANLVKVHGADVLKYKGKDIVTLSMDYLSNGSILALLNSANFMPMNEAKRLIIDTLRGLEFLHELGIYHNDIKPQNILLGDDGEGKLTDYGISSQAENGEAIQAKASYVLHKAREVIVDGNIDAQTDVYQVGMTLLRLLNGIGILEEKHNRLGRAKFLDAISKGRLIQPGDFAPFLPGSLLRVLRKAIHVDPSKRFQSALEMRRALEKIMFSGFWTVDVQGNHIGDDCRHTYRYEVKKVGEDYFNVTAFKRNKASGRETKMGAFTKRKISEDDMEALLKSFMLKVVEG